MRRRRVLASLVGAIALLAAVLWFAERGWRNAQQTAATPSPASAPAQREIFSVTGPETVTRGEAQTPPAAPNQAPLVPPNVTASSPASEPVSRTSRAASPQGVDERPLWRLLQQRRHEELRAAIAAHRQAHPEWQPPSQLLELLHTAEADAEYQRHLDALAQAKMAGDTARVLEEAAALAPLVEARRDAAGARALGWAHYDAGQDETAAQWFSKSQQWSPSEEAAYGRALARQRLGDHDAAMASAREYADSPRMAALLRDDALARARERHEAGDYDGSERALAEAARYGEWDRGARLLHAWNLAKLGQYEEAGDVFAELYRAAPDEASADGLLFSYGEGRDDATLARLSEELGGPLAQRYRLLQAQQAYGRKQFLAAHAEAPQAYPLLEHVDRPDAGIGAMTRRRSGSEGLSRLTLSKAPWLEGRLVSGGVYEWRLRVDDVHLDSGSLPAGALIGSAPAVSTSFTATPTTDMHAGAEPLLSVMREGRFTPYASIGTTPLRGPVDARGVGQLGATWYGARASATLEWSARPVRESILSYVGAVDPYTGTAWGRVVSSGVDARLYSMLGTRWSASARTQWMQLAGEQVQDNEHLTVDVAINRALRWRGMDRTTVGPFIGYERYTKNLSHFTLGHGGYFSPQRLLRAGVAWEGLTTEGAPFVARARVAAGYQTHRADAAPYLPLAPDGRMYAASDQSGAAIDLQWLGVWRMTPRWQLGGGAGYRRSPAYEDVFAGAFLRYSLAARPALFSRDLPASLFGAVE